MNAEHVKIRIEGTRRLIMHAGRLADPLDPVSKNLARLTSKKMKTEADHEAIGKTEWFGGLWLDGGVPCITAEALMATFIGAARTRRRGPQASAGLVVETNAKLEYAGPADLDALWEDHRFRLRVPVRVNSARAMRTRPCFEDWSAEFSASFLPTLLNPAEIVELFIIAGFTKGVGDWRPQNGTFTVKQIG
ncbi:hypothetical protein RPMA_27285 [Tardiphaga alba]|uniref:Uncharacterized protein n=1 Tax=Tardiphaga alba TaxID=340268 RepID=A0ABX8AJU3_9BRAD|nr:hypothetical protein [Tardiphaga alba]QUS42110.1 hypothetical protein RPMA_27285 [Tardiphaga alba]